MTAPVVQSSQIAVSSGAADHLAINTPASLASGDLLVAVIQGDSPVTFADPAGETWHNLFDLLDSGGAGATQTRASYRVADGTEGATLTWTNSGTPRGLAGRVYRITGQAASNFITFVTDVTQSGFHNSGTSPSIALPVHDCLVLCGISLDNTRTISSVTGAETITQDTAGGTNNNGVLFATGITGDTGTDANSGIGTWTLSSAATLSWLGYAICIAPPAAISAGSGMSGMSGMSGLSGIF